jgi:hypothetical protein
MSTPDDIEEPLHLLARFLRELAPVVHNLGWRHIRFEELALHAFVTMENMKFCLASKPEGELQGVAGILREVDRHDHASVRVSRVSFDDH